MSFKFNFGSCSKEYEEIKSVSISSKNDIEARQATFHKMNNEHLMRTKEADVCTTPVGNCIIKSLASQKVEEYLKNSKLSTIPSSSDLIPNIYEGGLKIWECSIDLANYLKECNITFMQVSVLELGCGAGIPGLLAYLSGSSVCFQDFNPEVLDFLTIPNVLLNTESSSQDYNERCTFVSGDWASVEEALKTNPKFDLIVSSETIYNKNSQRKLLSIMKSTLKSNGSIYLAAKTCYFGVGGTLRQFEELITNDGTFDFNTVWKTEEGVQREILHLWFKNG